MAEQQLAADKIPGDDLHFVLVGDSASAEGEFFEHIPRRVPGIVAAVNFDLFKEFAADEVLGLVILATTSHRRLLAVRRRLDNYDMGLNNAGLFTDHLEYLGLSRNNDVGGAPGGRRDDQFLRRPRLDGQPPRSAAHSLQIADSVLS